MKQIIYFISLFLLISCHKVGDLNMNKNANEFLGNSNYPAISYGGYRHDSREYQPSIEDIKEDLLILYAQGFRVIRTYDLHHPFAENTLKAIKQIKAFDKEFEMYVMLGAWIQCNNAFTESPNHEEEDIEGNKAEIIEAIRLAQDYADIVKIISVGNEAMVHWAWSYSLPPKYILKWVDYLQNLKVEGSLSKDLWITSSDNFASWGGGGEEYHNQDLEDLIKSVDYISMHTYAFHDTHYNQDFWNLKTIPNNNNKIDIIKSAMKRAVDYEIDQFKSVQAYVHNIDPSKRVHIGETGWSSVATDLYGYGGSEAADEYKLGLYFELITEEMCTCYQFHVFIFQLSMSHGKIKIMKNGSENHFGLFTVDGKAKYPMWKSVDQGIFNDLTRGGNKIIKTFDGDFKDLLDTSNIPPNIVEKAAN